MLRVRKVEGRGKAKGEKEVGSEALAEMEKKSQTPQPGCFIHKGERNGSKL